MMMTTRTPWKTKIRDVAVMMLVGFVLSGAGSVAAADSSPVLTGEDILRSRLSPFVMPLECPMPDPSVRSFSDLPPLHQRWSDFHRRNWTDLEGTGEMAKRAVAFARNCEFVRAHNARYASGDESYWVELNALADTPRGDMRRRLGYRCPASVCSVSSAVSDNDASSFIPIARSRRNRPGPASAPVLQAAAPIAGLPASVDWRKKGAVTAVKDQGQCGSCWAFSTIESVESAHFLKTGKLVVLSEQELVDCDDEDSGCNGGLMDHGFDWIEKNGGVATEKEYPYTAQDGACQQSVERKDKVATVSGFVDVAANNETALLAAIAKQPVSVAIEADQQAFQLYGGGIFTGPCGTQLDHGVVAVGYDEKSIFVRNSWGASYGENGYIRLARNMDAPYGLCGVAMAASYPVV